MENVWDLVEKAYIYAFPLMIMDTTMKVSTNTEEVQDMGKAPANQWMHAKKLATSKFRQVVTPNVDTLDSQLFMDLTEDAVVLHKPAVDRYVMFQVMDAWSDTVAVLGSGVDICYPREHEKLYEEIVGSGCILSEYPPGTVPREYYFPLRNRLIAALSDWLYVIEAGRHSGTVSTVESGEKYGREVKRELICSS